MKNKINCLNALLSAFESRNEKLHEEIKKNENAIAKMQEELNVLMEDEIVNDLKESEIKMV